MGWVYTTHTSVWILGGYAFCRDFSMHGWHFAPEFGVGKVPGDWLDFNTKCGGFPWFSVEAMRLHQREWLLKHGSLLYLKSCGKKNSGLPMSGDVHKTGGHLLNDLSCLSYLSHAVHCWSLEFPYIPQQLTSWPFLVEVIATRCSWVPNLQGLAAIPRAPLAAPLADAQERSFCTKSAILVLRSMEPNHAYLGPWGARHPVFVESNHGYLWWVLSMLKAWCGLMWVDGCYPHPVN